MDQKTLTKDYVRACQTIASMHAAAVGEVTGPIRGVVEDVEDIRLRLIAFENATMKLMRLREGVGSLRSQKFYEAWWELYELVRDKIEIK